MEISVFVFDSVVIFLVQLKSDLLEDGNIWKSFFVFSYFIYDHVKIRPLGGWK
ncbi:MAG: hypothetical protein GXN95_06890 [Methanococci archaeon]|nr:hypothetical protein [Methanococci archaeon]